MYKLTLNEKEYDAFCRKAKAVMALKKISIKRLSEKTGYKPKSLYNFFSGTNSKFLAFAIAKELGMEEADEK